jgi:hypothetical protein
MAKEMMIQETMSKMVTVEEYVAALPNAGEVR